MVKELLEDEVDNWEWTEIELFLFGVNMECEKQMYVIWYRKNLEGKIRSCMCGYIKNIKIKMYVGNI